MVQEQESLVVLVEDTQAVVLGMVCTVSQEYFPRDEYNMSLVVVVSHILDHDTMASPEEDHLHIEVLDCFVRLVMLSKMSSTCTSSRCLLVQLRSGGMILSSLTLELRMILGVHL